MASVAEKPSAEEPLAQLPAEAANLQEQVAEAPPPEAPAPGGLQVAKEEEDPQAVSAKEQQLAPAEDQEVEEGLRCATCHREVDVENTAVVNRQTGKRKEVRRCKSCHSLRAAVQRLQKNHGALVQDFTQAPCSKERSGDKVRGPPQPAGEHQGEYLQVLGPHPWMLSVRRCALHPNCGRQGCEGDLDQAQRAGQPPWRG